MKTIIIGATGMIGAALLQQLLAKHEVTSVTSLVRRPTGVNHPKLNEVVVDFSTPNAWEHLVVGDILYSCMGTTLADAGSKHKQFDVDYHYQYYAAQAAHKNAVSKYVIISSAGANEKSKNFYLGMKGKLDNDAIKLNFNQCYIFRPGQLWGHRSRKRWAEGVAIKFMFFINRLGLMLNYRPIHAEELAMAMINASFDATKTQKVNIYKLSEIFNLI